MAELTWFTHPQNAFDSLYLYNTENRLFIRARMELGRAPVNDRDGHLLDDGNPGIAVRKNRIVLYVPSDIRAQLDTDKTRWKYNTDTNEVTFDGVCQNIYRQFPTEKQNLDGYKVCDFSFTLSSQTDSVSPDNNVHFGNTIMGEVGALHPASDLNRLKEVIRRLVGANPTVSDITFDGITRSSTEQQFRDFFTQYGAEQSSPLVLRTDIRRREVIEPDHSCCGCTIF